jgi:hypothetical protein
LQTTLYLSGQRVTLSRERGNFGSGLLNLSQGQASPFNVPLNLIKLRFGGVTTGLRSVAVCKNLLEG